MPRQVPHVQFLDSSTTAHNPKPCVVMARARATFRQWPPTLGIRASRFCLLPDIPSEQARTRIGVDLRAGFDRNGLCP